MWKWLKCVSTQLSPFKCQEEPVASPPSPPPPLTPSPSHPTSPNLSPRTVQYLVRFGPKIPPNGREPFDRYLFGHSTRECWQFQKTTQPAREKNFGRCPRKTKAPKTRRFSCRDACAVSNRFTKSFGACVRVCVYVYVPVCACSLCVRVCVCRRWARGHGHGPCLRITRISICTRTLTAELGACVCLYFFYTMKDATCGFFFIKTCNLTRLFQ